MEDDFDVQIVNNDRFLFSENTGRARFGEKCINLLKTTEIW